MEFTEKEYRKERDNSIFIRKGKKTLRWNIAKSVGMNMIYLSLYALFISVVLLIINSTVFAAAVLIISLSVEFIILYRAVSKKKKEYREFAERIYKMPDWEFSSLCRQVNESPLYFGKIYLLDDHIYVPCCMLLLPYNELQNLRAFFKRRNLMYSEAFLDIYHHGIMTSVSIIDIYGFKEKHAAFIEFAYNKKHMSEEKQAAAKTR